MRNLGLIIAGLLAATPVAAATAVRPAARDWPVQQLSQVELYSAPAVDAEALVDEDEWRAEEGLPYRYALPQSVRLTPSDSGVWEDLPDGRSLWRLRVGSPGALSLNLGFTEFMLPDGAHLLIYPATGETRPQVYGAQDNAPHGQLWTPVLLSDEIVAELVVPRDRRQDVVLTLTSIGRGYRMFGDPLKSGACNVDVVCPEGDPWRDEIAAVALLSISGHLNCTGALVNNTAADGRPLFLTAYHCAVTAAAAPTLVTYWNFESPVCDQHGGGTLDQTTSGSSLLATWSTSDFTLVELDEVPDVAYGVKYAGWSRSETPPSSAVGIHHPSLDEKSISFEDDPLDISSYEPTGVGDGAYWRVNDWDLGTTEPGSSGSPLFDPERRIIGQLRGGYASCDNNSADYYGRLPMSWTGGGNSATRLSDWLDPAGTGALAVGAFDPYADTGFEVTPTTGLVALGVVGGSIEPGGIIYTLTNIGSVAAPFTAVADATWLAVDPASGTVPVDGSVEVVVTFTEATGTLSTGTYVGLVAFDNTALGAGATEREVTLRMVAATPAPVAAMPNPFRTFTEVGYTLSQAARVRWRVLDMRGAIVYGGGVDEGEAGENFVAWNGRDDDDRRLPSGRYVLELQVEGRTQRTGVTLLR